MRKSCVLAALLSLTVSAGACVGASKSANPLSPTIAGPIAGVGIVAPTVVEPAIDALVNTTTQPITLKVGNAVTNGVRPLTYTFEIATDFDFTNKVLTQGNIPQGEGITSFTLPAALAPDRKYYWHARGEDGANASLFSGTSAFSVYTPVIFGPPGLLAPINGVTTTSAQPRFVLANAGRVGPAQAVAYYLEVRNSSGDLVAVYQFPETPGQSDVTAPASLAAGVYSWRAQAYDSGFTGPFSSSQTFISPGVTGGGGGGGGGVISNPGQACGPPYPTEPMDILNCRRSQYGDPMSKSESLAFLSGSAKDMNAAGVPAGPFGILRKESGNNCGGYSCDIICTGQGNDQLQYDVLIDERIPTWGAPHGVPGIRIDHCAIQ